MAVVIRLQGLPIVAGTMDIRHFFSGLTIPDGGVHIVGGELDGRVRVPGGAGRGLAEPPRRDLSSRSDSLCVLPQDAGDGRWAELDHTEEVKNCQDPEFCKKLVVDYYFDKVQKLKFSVYDIDTSPLI
ncbi:RNA-binding protein 12 isoform X2 [Molothrus aeneus]|uniref:RNA-binding protein 12 isoform X2 n=1 Tax=Molothrus ater TaxID=84834 RepID=UPI00174AEE89|nr:RNA-binding protein 12 isoform X2 [Molothrus ater]